METFLFTIMAIAFIIIGIALANMVSNRIDSQINKREELQAIQEVVDNLYVHLEDIIKKTKSLELQLQEIKRGMSEEIPEWGKITDQDIKWR
jgi:uncharacterized protein YoxC